MPHVPAKNSIEDQHSMVHALLHERVFEGKGLLLSGAGIRISVNADGQYVIESTARGGGAAPAGWQWATPQIELPAAPYPAYSKGMVINIQATHAIVTTGIRDAANPSGPLVKSKPGLWVAMQAVPAQASSGGNPVWNLPQFPLPAPSNYDDATNFWYFLGKTFC